MLKDLIKRIASVAFFAMLLSPVLAHAAVLAPNNLGLVGYWNFNESSGTVAHDASGKGNNSTSFVGSPSWTSGKLGNALSFNGTSQYINIPQGSGTNLNFSSYGSFSVSAWVYVTDTTTGHPIIGFGNPYSNGGQGLIILYGYPTLNDFGIVINDGSGTASGIAFGPASQITKNKWTLATFVFTNTTATLYVNGLFIVTEDISSFGTSSLGNSLLRIGAYGDGLTAKLWQGDLDDIRIYNRALGAAEIQSLYQEGAATIQAPNNNGLVGYWNFNEGSGTVAHDASGNNNNGSFVATPVWVSGKLGDALSFNGSTQYITISQGAGTNLNFSSYSSFSISGWVYTTDASTGHAFVGTGNPYNNNGTGFIISYGYPTANQFGVEIDDGTGLGVDPTFTGSQLVKNKWTYVTFTFTSTAISLYMNGIFIGTTGISSYGLSDLGNNPFRIAAFGSSPTVQIWQGDLDEIRVYSRALGAAEIQALYKESASEFDVPSPTLTINSSLASGLVGFWTFDGGTITSTTVTDLSGHGHNGTLVSSPTLVAGKLGQAIAFNGSNSITYGTNVSDFQFGLGNFSVSAWVYPVSGVTPAIWGVGQGANASRYALDYVGQISGGCTSCFQAFIKDDAGNSTQISSGVVPMNKWSYATMVVNRSTNTMSIYLNGVLSNSESISSITGNLTGQSTAVTNQIINGGSPTMTGDVDDLRVYNRALSVSEVKQLYLFGH